MAKIYIPKKEKEILLNLIKSAPYDNQYCEKIDGKNIVLKKIYVGHINEVKKYLIDNVASIVSEYVEDIINVHIILNLCNYVDRTNTNCICFHASLLIYNTKINFKKYCANYNLRIMYDKYEIDQLTCQLNRGNLDDNIIQSLFDLDGFFNTAKGQHS